jgi:hypothetical protein
LSGGLCDPTDRQALVERAIAFLAAGFRTPVRPQVGEQAEEPTLVHIGA